MDSLTQAVLGAAVGQQAAGKTLGNRAVLYGAMLGTIPDLDVYAGKFYDTVTALEVHRGFSHSIVFYLMLAPVLAWLIQKLEKGKIQYIPALKMTFLCLVTHPILDAFTTWGTQLFWPLEQRLDFKTIFVIDPLYTLPFLYCLVRGMLAKEWTRRIRWNTRGLVISSCYLVLSVVIKTASVNVFTRALDEQNIAYSRLIVKPSPMNLILWNANIETQDGYYLADYSYFDSSPISFVFYPKGYEFLGEMTRSPVIMQLTRISEGWFIITKQDGKVFFNDLRFGLMNDDPKNPKFVFSYELTSHQGTIVVKEVDKNRDDAAAVLGRLMERIAGR
ncbi:MAG TPA: metal-dependent hydrolase [Flavobacterium sp.]|nr:metal-dependent hydrolase [Flavobacterium sp.]